MKQSSYTLLLLAALSISVLTCKKKNTTIPPAPAPRLIFKFKFDSTQVRLDNFGQPSSVGAGHAAQSPKFHSMSSHYIELAPSDNTPMGSGAVLYRAPETTLGGGSSSAIDFNASKVVGEGEEFFSIPLKDVAAGSYKWLRVSLAYQNYDITYKYNYSGTDYYFTGRLASFIGFNTYITNYTIATKAITVNGNKAQGYWGFETSPFGITSTYEGQTPAGATTVPNPINSTSPIPAGSCVVTGQFANNLAITGTETKDIIVIVSLSTNNSFEWNDTTADGFYEPDAPGNETVTDMGIRGLIPIVQ